MILEVFWFSKMFLTMRTFVLIFSMIHQHMASEVGWGAEVFITYRTLATFILFVSQKYMKPKIQSPSNYQWIDKFFSFFKMCVKFEWKILYLTSKQIEISAPNHKIYIEASLSHQSELETCLSWDQLLILRSLYDAFSCAHTQDVLGSSFYHIRYIFEHFLGN